MIQINENYAMTSDDLNYILLKKTNKREKVNGKWIDLDEYYFKPCGYYPTLERLVIDITRKELRSTEFKELDIVLKKIEELENMVKKLNLK